MSIMCVCVIHLCYTSLFYHVCVCVSVMHAVCMYVFIFVLMKLCIYRHIVCITYVIRRVFVSMCVYACRCMCVYVVWLCVCADAYAWMIPGVKGACRTLRRETGKSPVEKGARRKISG